MAIDVDKICQDLYEGTNYPGMWHGYDFWGKASDFHEHPFFVWETIQKVFFKDGIRPLNIVETGRCTGQSTNLFSGIAQLTGGKFISYDVADWNRDHILQMNEKYGISEQHYNYVTDSSLNAEQYFPQDFKIQIVFLDSLHSYELVKQETLIFEKYLDSKAIIFFHDTIWCFDAVMGWVKDYLSDKDVIFAKHKDTDKPQCAYCDKFSTSGQMHGRPIMEISGRPNFQSPYDKLEESPHYNILNYDFINWSDKSFEDCVKDEDKLIFTNIEANCGIGTLIINK